MLSKTILARATIDSAEAKATCGVTMVFLACSSGWAVSSGLSARIGSVDTTSSPAAASLPLFRASATACESTTGPRAVLMR